MGIRLGGGRPFDMASRESTLRMLTACRNRVPVERMAWEPLGNGCVLRLNPSET